MPVSVPTEFLFFLLLFSSYALSLPFFGFSQRIHRVLSSLVKAERVDLEDNIIHHRDFFDMSTSRLILHYPEISIYVRS